jgi:hypothetical protein
MCSLLMWFMRMSATGVGSSYTSRVHQSSGVMASSYRTLLSQPRNSSRALVQAFALVNLEHVERQLRERLDALDRLAAPSCSTS